MTLPYLILIDGCPRSSYRTPRRSGGGYRAVAEWRGVENANLAFHKTGIKDFGNDEAHTPLNVVMLAFKVDLYVATKWMISQIGFAG